MDDWRPNFNWITELIAVGGSVPPERIECLAREHRVQAVIDLRGEARPEEQLFAQHGIALLHLPTEDMYEVGPSDLEHGIRFANTYLDKEQRVLIHCAQGIGRSATLALCVLVHRGHEPLAALRLMKQQRAIVAPSPPQFRSWLEWLDSYSFSREVTWRRPSFEQLAAIAYRR